MLDLDEIDFVESPVEKKILAPFFSIDFDGVFQTRLITDTALVPLYLAKTTTESSLSSLTSDGLLDPIATFFDRTQFYHILTGTILGTSQNELLSTYLLLFLSRN
jgi:hypothetical protein